jgi:cytochrome oxidase Cu insertion factor (SCO1/SenC/PrrC family)
MTRTKYPVTGVREEAKARRRAKERRQTSVVLTVLALALTASVASWAVFFSAWTPATIGQAPSFTLPSSTGDPVSLADFLGKQDVVLVFYMVAT